jgi:DNA-binding Lrp family transcriptional regulator
VLDEQAGSGAGRFAVNHRGRPGRAGSAGRSGRRRCGISAPQAHRGADDLDAVALGDRTEAFVEIHCAANMSPTALRETLAAEPEILAAWTVTGDADAVAHVRATDVAHLEAAVERIRANPAIARTKTIIVLSTLIGRGDS